jgi:hypothetical protein
MKIKTNLGLGGIVDLAESKHACRVRRVTRVRVVVRRHCNVTIHRCAKVISWAEFEDALADRWRSNSREGETAELDRIREPEK